MLVPPSYSEAEEEAQAGVVSAEASQEQEQEASRRSGLQAQDRTQQPCGHRRTGTKERSRTRSRCRRCRNKGLFFFLSQVRQSYQTGVSRQRLELERCEEIIKKLMKYRYSWPFR